MKRNRKSISTWVVVAVPTKLANTTPNGTLDLPKNLIKGVVPQTREQARKLAAEGNAHKPCYVKYHAVKLSEEKKMSASTTSRETKKRQFCPKCRGYLHLDGCKNWRCGKCGWWY